ncbi:MAG: helix-turn-helix domain-containing protein [Vicinamibacterales bacterium]
MVSPVEALNPDEPKLGRSVSLDHAAELLGVSRRTVYNRIRDGRLQTIRTRGGSQRVLLESVTSFLAGSSARFALQEPQTRVGREIADVNQAWPSARAVTGTTGGRPDAGHEQRSNAATDYLGQVDEHDSRIAVSPGEHGSFSAQANIGDRS